MFTNCLRVTWLNVVLFVCLASIMLIVLYNRNLTGRSYLVLVHEEFTSKSSRLGSNDREPRSHLSPSSGSPLSASTSPTSPSTVSDSPSSASTSSTLQSTAQSRPSINPPSQHLSDLSETHVWGVPMEAVHANYTRNIYFSVKSTYRYYSKRLLDLMLTWFQVVDKHKLTIVSDKSPGAQLYVDTIRKAGFHIVDSNCSTAYSDTGLCCKLGTEFAGYYEAVEQHKDDKDSYQWFCHFDDDVYVNVPQLSKLLQQYDPHQPYYLGKWPGKQRGGQVDIGLSNHTARHMMSLHTLKQMAFRYATGAAYCISQAVMMEGKRFFNGQKTYWETYTLAHLPDDMTVGLVIGTILGYNLTDTDSMKNQYDYLYPSSLDELSRYVTVSQTVENASSLKKMAITLKKHLSTSTKFGSYHCLLYPSVSWCQR